MTIVLSDYTKQRVLSLHWQGCKVTQIVECLVLEEAITVSKQGVRKFLKHFADRLCFKDLSADYADH